MTPPLPHPNLDEAIEAYVGGESLHALLQRTGVSKTVLYRALRRGGMIQQRNLRDVDSAGIIAAYGTGASVAELSRQFEVSRHTIVERLRTAGITPRGRSESGRLVWSQREDTSRSDQVAAANDATRGRVHTLRERGFAALTREHRGTMNRPERALYAALTAIGLTAQPQRAVGPYNLDFAIPPVAVEIFGTRFHSEGTAIRRLAQRIPYILDAGWALHVTWISEDVVLDPRLIAEDIHAFTEICRSEPAGGGRYRVVWGDGQLAAAGRTDGDHRPFMPPSHR